MTLGTRAAMVGAFCAMAVGGRAATLDVCAAACTYSTIQAAEDVAAPGDVIDIAAGTYVGDVDVDVANLTIQGAGAGITFVEGFGFASFIFRETASPAVLTGVTLRSPVAQSCLYNYEGSLVVRDSTFEDCQANQMVNASYAGGAIFTTGDLVLRRVTVRNNTAAPGTNGLGGGLYVGLDPFLGAVPPVVRIYDSTFSGNSALTGGAIYVVAGARLFVDGTTLSDNTADGTTVANNRTGQGGAIYTEGELHLTDSVVADNFADQSGGGVAVAGVEDATIANSVFTGNATTFLYAFPPYYTGGGLFVQNSGTVTVSGSRFEGNTARTGGAIGSYNLLTGGEIKVTSSTLSANTALYGGGVYALGGGPFVLGRVTIEGNTATQTGSGGGVYSALAATVELKDATVALNTSEGSGGGVTEGGGSLSLRNTIVAENTATVAVAGNSTNDCSGSLDSDDFNLVGTLDGCSWFAQGNDLSGTDAAPIDPLLLALADNGGLTNTLLPAAGSPALDSGGACTARDQRGLSRPVDGGTGVVQCDRGAVEVGGACTAPGPATILEPLIGAVGVSTDPLLVWEPASHGLTYNVLLSTNPLITGGVIGSTFGRTATHWKPAVALAPATTYFWRITSFSECGNASANAIASFTTP